ncbi:MAG TPA: single-stranded DNA-binding protein [Patescibacteria group bacterium]|nr:single-stranded DNA-binding protein [Patescibacteria group bacterium]
MSSRSLNKVQLIGNLTRDPELRYTPTGAAVCTIGLATNRTWTTESGEKKEETEFHRVVAWNKLAELCSQLLAKGRKIYVEGRLRTNSWTAQDGSQRSTTEVVIEDMIILDSRRPVTGEAATEAGNEYHESAPATAAPATSALAAAQPPAKPVVTKKQDEPKPVAKNETKAAAEEVNPDDIPF